MSPRISAALPVEELSRPLDRDRVDLSQDAVRAAGDARIIEHGVDRGVAELGGERANARAVGDVAAMDAHAELAQRDGVLRRPAGRIDVVAARGELAH